MIPRGLLLYALTLLGGLTSLGETLASPAIQQERDAAYPGSLHHVKREPISFPIKQKRQTGTLSSLGRRMISFDELTDIRRKDFSRINAALNLGNEPSRKRDGWETVALSSFSPDAFYYISMDIGTPAQTVDVSIDTGSSDLWVQSSTCTTCSNNLVQPSIDNSKPSFTSSQSTTYHSTSQTATLSYADGSAIKGTISTDTVSVGQYTSTNQTFILVTAQNSDFNTAGLMGLGWPALAQSRGTPWWLATLSQYQEPEYSLFLAQWNDPTATYVTAGGQFTLGGRNSSLYTGEVQFVPLQQEAWWQIPFESIKVSSNTTLTLTGSYSSAIVDSGTTLIYGPDEVVEAFYAAVPGAVRGETLSSQLSGEWVAPCTAVINPVFKFTDTVNVTVPSTNVLWLQVSQEYCVGSLMGTGVLSSSFAATDNQTPAFKKRNETPAFDKVSADPNIVAQPASTTAIPPAATSSIPSPPGDIPSTPSWILGGTFMKSTYVTFRAGVNWNSANPTTGNDPPAVGFAPIRGVDYATDGWAVIGDQGNGVDGRIGEAGVTVQGVGNPTQAGGAPSAASVSSSSSGGTTVFVSNGQTSNQQQNGSTQSWGQRRSAVGAVEIGVIAVVVGTVGLFVR